MKVTSMDDHRPRSMSFCFTIAVWSICLLRNAQTFETQDTLEELPEHSSIKAFENLTDDSYLNGNSFPHHRFRVKREIKALSSPQIFKFSVEDAREPDEATKTLIRMHRGRELQLENMSIKNPKMSHSKRTKRLVQLTKPQFINFEVSDAKEPDEITKELIKRSREMEIKTKQMVITTGQDSTRKVTRRPRRMRRYAQRTQPRYIRFELEDAKIPDSHIKTVMQKFKGREIMFEKSNETETIDDSTGQESNRFIFHQAVPVKSRHTVNAIPLEVHQIIESMLKDKKATAHYKSIAANQEAKFKAIEKLKQAQAATLHPISSAPAANQLVTIYPEPAFVQKLIPVPIPRHSIPINSLPPSPPESQSTAKVPYPVTAPEVTRNQQYYHPSVPTQSNIATYQTYYQPSESQVYQQTSNSVIPVVTPIFNAGATPTAVQSQSPLIPFHNVHSLGRLPLQNQQGSSLNSIVNNEKVQHPFVNLIPIVPSYRYAQPINSYSTTESHTPAVGRAEPQQQLVAEYKINSKQQSSLNEVQEFHELSSLIGRSPTDQIHGLAYLLAKEMQRSKHLTAQRPQDNTSPILFHTEKDSSNVIPHSGELSSQSDQPILEPTIADNDHVIEPRSEPTKIDSSTPLPRSISFDLDKTQGLSPNYQTNNQFDEALQSTFKDLNKVQYNSKYEFGYHVRDFESGNDFGHKQNRDLDGVVRGQYHILLPDGHVQNVIYHADDTGFHADVSFESGHP